VYFGALLFRRNEVFDLNVTCFESIDRCFRRPVALLPAVVVEQHSATLNTLLRHGLDTVLHCAATFAINAVASTEDIT
jgi:hypothetical protein